MRSASYINDIWNGGGPFAGDEAKPHTRVTVQRPWSDSDPAVLNGDEDHVIHPTSTKVGNSKTRGVPLRWFQKRDNSQSEDEIPNIMQVSIDRSVETDAATCDITLYNQWMYDNGAVPEEHWVEGNRHLAGYFSPSRGMYPEGQVRWGQETNEWADTLVPNAILRTYQGFGGHSKTLEECLEDGNLILTGIWLIDEVQISTNGQLEMKCRDTAKLLVDQQLFPPLIPSNKYPLSYYRWVYTNVKIKAHAVRKTTTVTTKIPVGDKRCVFRDSSVDRWYPGSLPLGGKLLHGHRGSHSVDGNTGTYWLGEGNSGPDRAFAVNWIEYTCGELMNAVYVHPWAGNYTMYISVMVGGVWQGSSTVPYDPSELYASQTVVNTGANIRYVMQVGVPWETGRQFVLPRVYKADRVRITFRHLSYSGIGPWMYRSGVREFRIRATSAAGSISTSKTVTVEPYFSAAAGLRNPDNLNATGYVTCSRMGHVDAFGDCRLFPSTGGDPPSSAQVGCIALTSTGNGYWTLRWDGEVSCFGAAQYFGSPHADGLGRVGSAQLPEFGQWSSICPTPSNEGYWVLAHDGRIRAYGDATPYANVALTGDGRVCGASPLVAGHGLFIAVSHPQEVHVRGAATHYGHYTGTILGDWDGLVCVVPTMAGDGYWLSTTAGRVEAKGAAVDYGQIANPSAEDYHHWVDQLIPIPSDDGYLLIEGIGTVFFFGSADWFGSPLPGTTGQIRSDGNYKDYGDIIRDLALWSGFLLYDEDLASNETPAVYGNIESTGSFSEEQLPDDLFDKRPVIDAMTQLKEAVGYLLFVDDEGGLRFESPNFWSYGNFLQENGERVYDLPEIDEEVNLVDYSASWNDESLRSLIIISSEDPTEAGETTVTTRAVPQTATGLRGILKPAMWVNGWFQDEEEQKIMAELIAMHIWFAQRVGQVTCVANPAIQINDQVRIYERQTSDVFIHYVRGVNTQHNLDTGSYTMTLTTHWLGSGEDWALTDDTQYVDDPGKFVLSPRLILFLKKRGNVVSTAGQDAPFLLGSPNTDPSFVNTDPDGPGGDPGSDGAGPG